MFSRHFPAELFIGQRVMVHLSPTSHPIPALITFIDTEMGVVHVNPIGYKVRWQARPRAITTTTGHYLHFENNAFYYSEQPNVA